MRQTLNRFVQADLGLGRRGDRRNAKAMAENQARARYTLADMSKRCRKQRAK